MDGEYSSLQLIISFCLSFQDASVRIKEYLSDTKDNHTYYDSKKIFLSTTFIIIISKKIYFKNIKLSTKLQHSDVCPARFT